MLEKTTLPKQPRRINMSFRGVRLIELSFKAKKPPCEYNFEPTIEIGYLVDKQKKILEVLLGAAEKRRGAPYVFEVRSVGHFVFEELPDSQQIEIFARINCSAIMFPYVRETIADMTRRAGYPPLHLDPVNFVELSSRFTEKKPKKKVKKK